MKNSSRKVLSKVKRLNMDLESININIQPLRVLINRNNTNNEVSNIANEGEGNESIKSKIGFYYYFY